MPRKEQGWITFQSSDEERKILEQICQQTQRTKTEVLREMIRQLGQASSEPVDVNMIEFSDDIEADEADSTTVEIINPATRQTAQLSARNILKATIKRVVKGSVNAEVTLTISPGVELVSTVTRTSADRLGLKKGKEVFAVIKSSSVMIAG